MSSCAPGAAEARPGPVFAMAGAAEQVALLCTRHFSLVADCDKQWAYAGLMPPHSRSAR